MLRHGSRLLARSFRASGPSRHMSAAVEVEPPKAFDTAGRYANALYNAAKKGNVVDAVSADVEQMQSMQAANSTLNEFLLNPTLPRAAKTEAIEEIVQKAGFSAVFSNFLRVLAENGRTAEAAKSLASFQEIIATLKGEVTCKVTTTVPLTDWELALLKKKIKQRFFADNPDTELAVETAIDEDLLGGLTVQVGDRFMDLSTRTELRKLQEVILKSVA